VLPAELQPSLIELRQTQQGPLAGETNLLLSRGDQSGSKPGSDQVIFDCNAEPHSDRDISLQAGLP
jgi:hypothetical protein